MDFVEHRFDYSNGRQDAPELTVMVGLSGSGKSTLCKQWMNWTQGKALRLNRDDMRRMLYADVPWTAHRDSYVRPIQQEMARRGLAKGLDVYIDDTNCVKKTRDAWEALARESFCHLRFVVMTVSLEECVHRDSLRSGSECVGEMVIRKQLSDLTKHEVAFNDAGKPQAKPVNTKPVGMRLQLVSNGFGLRLPNAKIVIYDVDGTLCDHNGVRNPYDESRVLFDHPYPQIVAQMRKDYETKNVFIVSGRKDKSGDDTIDWMGNHDAPFDLMLMRRTKDNRPDVEVKTEILDEILVWFPLEKIEYVVDDRPVVCRMWERRGLTVIWARGRDLADF